VHCKKPEQRGQAIRLADLPTLTIATVRGRRYGVIKWRGEQRWLGPADDEQTHVAFAKLRAHIAQHGRLPARADRDAPMTVAALADAYEQHVRAYYVKGGKETSEVGLQAFALRFLRSRHETLAAAQFGPLALKDCREAMVREGLARTTCNGYVARIRQCFRWGVENELVPSSVLEGLRAVAGLKRGRTEAVESAGVQPVAEDVVRKVLPFVSRQVAAMLQLQLLTGMRPGEVVGMRWSHIDRSGATWLYRVDGHKNEHHGSDRVIPLGPRARELLQQFRKVLPRSVLFSPADAERLRNRARSAARSLPQWPSHAPEHRRERRGARGRVREAYGVDSYRRAVSRACGKAKVPVFSPNQIRHTVGTQVRDTEGLDTAQAMLGHKELQTTQVYAAVNLQRVIALAERIG
jgi:integrase